LAYFALTDSFMLSIFHKALLRLPFHYGWLITISGIFCIFACLGLGRFSLGMLLPSMGEALELSYSEMGLDFKDGNA